MLLGISASNSNYQIFKRALNILCKSIINRPTEGLRIALKIKTKQKKSRNVYAVAVKSRFRNQSSKYYRDFSQVYSTSPPPPNTTLTTFLNLP